MSKIYCSVFCFTRFYAPAFCLHRIVQVFNAKDQKQLYESFYAYKLCNGSISLIILVTSRSKVRRLTSALRGLSRPGMNSHFACAQGVSYINNRCSYLSPLCAGSLAKVSFSPNNFTFHLFVVFLMVAYDTIGGIQLKFIHNGKNRTQKRSRKPSQRSS